MALALRFRTAVLMLALALAWTVGSAASGLDTISQLAGCFEVTYRFVEDGTHDIFSDEDRLTNPTKEWISLTRTGEHAFLLVHVLIVGSGLLPHWHEVWRQAPDTQDWTQEIWGGAPGPGSEVRYGCTAPWVGNRWECHAGRAQKPLRDDKRDYDWLDRKNVILVTPNGFVQNEHNRKMQSSGEVVSYELGWLTYTRIGEDQCGRAPEQFPKELRSQAGR